MAIFLVLGFTYGLGGHFMGFRVYSLGCHFLGLKGLGGPFLCFHVYQCLGGHFLVLGFT